jgi:hypothetical protein
MSNIKVCGEKVEIVVQITADKYTIATANAKAEYLWENSEPFPLAQFGLTLLNAVNGQTINNVEISKEGLITSVATESGTIYTLKHK